MKPIGQNEIVKEGIKYQAALIGYACTILQNWSLAQEVVQEAFVIAMEKCGELDAIENTFSWMREIVRLQALAVRRKQTRQNELGDTLAELVGARYKERMDEQAAAALQEEQQTLYECMSKLSSASRTLLLRFYRDRKSTEELGKTFRKSANAVRLSLTRIRQALRKCVKGQLAELRAEQ